MKNKSGKDANRDQSFEKLYQNHNEFNEFIYNNDYNGSVPGGPSSFKRNFLERRIYEERFGVFGNALITVAVIAALLGILYLLY